MCEHATVLLLECASVAEVQTEHWDLNGAPSLPLTSSFVSPFSSYFGDAS